MKAQTHTRRFCAPSALLSAVFLSGALLIPLSGQSTNANPVSHAAYIPAGSDLTTMRFEKARLVKTASSTAAYEITYSYLGPPMRSDPLTNGQSTFTTYFQPDELSPKVRKALLQGKLSRSDLAGYFTVGTSRDTVRKMVIDSAQSRFCPGFNYVDGKTRTNTDCQDELHYKWVLVPSPYITVTVNTVSGVSPRPAIALAQEP